MNYTEKQIKEMKRNRLKGSMCFMHKASFACTRSKRKVDVDEQIKGLKTG